MLGLVAPPLTLLATQVQDLLALQSEIAQYAPELSGQWGYLAKQGQLLASGQPASITAATWQNMYHNFLVAAMKDPNALQTNPTSFADAVYNEGSTGFWQNAGDSVSQLPTNIGNAVGNMAATVGNAAGQAVGAAIPPVANALPWGWIIAGIAAIVLVPVVIREMENGR